MIDECCKRVAGGFQDSYFYSDYSISADFLSLAFSFFNLPFAQIPLFRAIFFLGYRCFLGSLWRGFRWIPQDLAITANYLLAAMIYSICSSVLALISLLVSFGGWNHLVAFWRGCWIVSRVLGLYCSLWRVWARAGGLHIAAFVHVVDYTNLHSLSSNQGWEGRYLSIGHSELYTFH